MNNVSKLMISYSLVATVKLGKEVIEGKTFPNLFEKGISFIIIHSGGYLSSEELNDNQKGTKKDFSCIDEITVN